MDEAVRVIEHSNYMFAMTMNGIRTQAIQRITTEPEFHGVPTGDDGKANVLECDVSVRMLTGDARPHLPSEMVNLVQTFWRLLSVPNRRTTNASVSSWVTSPTATMEALDRESFEFRAEFFGRTLEEELVGSMNGPRGGEAVMRLNQIAQTRGIRVSEIVAEQAALETERRNSGTNLFAAIFSSFAPSKSRTPPPPSKPPSRIYDVEECPVCTDNEHFGALECGHVICRVCYEQLCARSATGDSCPCPQCRTTSRRLWDFTELKNVEHVVVE